MKNKNQFQWKTGVAAVLLAFAGTAEAAGPSNEDLQKKIEELQKIVEALQQQVAKQGGPVAAQPAAAPEELATKSDIDGLRSDLENYKYSQQRDRERKTVLSARGTTLLGTVQVRATGVSSSTTATTSTPAEPRHSSFDIPLAQLGVAGSLYRDYSEGRNLDYRVLFGYTPNVQSGFPTSANGTSTAAANGSQFNLLDAYVNYSPFPTVTGLEEDRLTLRFGQQLIPYGLEPQVGEDLRPTINPAQFILGGAITKSASGVPTGVNGHGVANRQIGFIVRGDLNPYVDYTANYRAPLVEYNFGIVNGSTTNKSDDNSDKDYIARAAFTLPVDYNSWLRELKFGASVYKGRRNLTAASTAGGAQSFNRVGRNDRVGFDIYYNHNPIGITYEYSEGRDDAVADVSFARSTIKSRGQYLTFFGQWGEQFLTSIKSSGKFDDWWPKSQQIFLRFDHFDPNVDISRNETWITSAGLNIFFAETTKFQVNLLRTDNRAAGQKDSNALLAQFQYGF